MKLSQFFALLDLLLVLQPWAEVPEHFQTCLTVFVGLLIAFAEVK